MTPQFPFKTPYQITQGYGNTAPQYPVRHGALDIVPLENGHGFPAPIYPVFSGHMRYFLDDNDIQGRSISVESELDAPLIAYLKDKDLVPRNFNGKVSIICLYLHALYILDKDGTVDQDTPIAQCGNTGMVYSGGVPVPDDQKGKPPYPGLHLHLQMMLFGGDNPAANTFNLDKDVQGRIDPQIILNYKNEMTNAYIVKNGSEYAGALPLTAEAALVSFLLNVGVEPPKKPDGSLDFDKLSTVIKVINL